MPWANMLSLYTFLSLCCSKQCLGPIHLSLGVFLSDVAVVDAQGHAAFQHAVIDAGVGQVSRFRMLREGTAEAVEPLIKNFSFALLMTCIGILIILGVLLLSIMGVVG